MSLIEELRDTISMAEAAALFPGQPNISSLFRYATKGVRGVTLKSWFVGGARVTKRECVEEFLQALNADSAAATTGGTPNGEAAA